MGYNDKLYNDYISFLMDTKNSKCVFSDCAENAIHSHIISKHIFNQIAKNGHVYWIKKGDNPYSANRAYTYPAFCHKHDNELFRRIDEEDYQLRDSEQQFLYFYRTYAGELVRTRKKIEFIHENGYFHDGKNIIAFKHMPKDLLETYAFLYERFKVLTQSLLNRKYDTIESINMVFNDPYPICVGQYLDLNSDFSGNYISGIKNGISIVVFPQNMKTYVIISWFKEDSDKLGFIPNTFLTLSEKKQKTLLSMLILNRCTNLVYGIDYWDSLKAKVKEKIFYLYGLDIIKEKINIFVN